MIAYLNGNRLNDVHFHGGGSGGDIEGAVTDWSSIGYADVPKVVQDGIEYAKEIQTNWDASKTDRTTAFYGDTKLVYFPVVDTSNVTKMYQMFYGCYQLSVFPTEFNTSAVTDMNSMFKYCICLTSLDLSSWNTISVKNMKNMFDQCSGLTSLDLSSWNTSNVSEMYGMFSGCTKLTSLDVSNFDTSNVTNLRSMFQNCSGLTSLDLSSWNTSNVNGMSDMFNGCSGLTTLDISSFNTSAVTTMYAMFRGCSGLTSLDISNFDTSKVTNIGNMFYGCNNLKQLKWSNLGNGSGYTAISFSNSSNLGVGYETDLKNTFVHNSFDRASAGFSTCTLTLHKNTQKLFTDAELAAITANGYTIA